MMNFYNSLGVSTTASQDEIKRAYIRLARRYHPDTNPDLDDIVFKRLTEAYATLNDRYKRSEYDHSPARFMVDHKSPAFATAASGVASHLSVPTALRSILEGSLSMRSAHDSWSQLSAKIRWGWQEQRWRQMRHYETYNDIQDATFRGYPLHVVSIKKILRWFD